MKTLTILPVKTRTTLSLEKHSIINDCLFVKTSDTIYKLSKDSIIYLQAQGNYTLIYTHKGKICSAKTLKFYVDLLGNQTFVRPHQSYLVNIRCIDELQYDSRSCIKLESGVIIPISRSRKAELLSKFQNY